MALPDRDRHGLLDLAGFEPAPPDAAIGKRRRRHGYELFDRDRSLGPSTSVRRTTRKPTLQSVLRDLDESSVVSTEHRIAPVPLKGARFDSILSRPAARLFETPCLQRRARNSHPADPAVTGRAPRLLVGPLASISSKIDIPRATEMVQGLRHARIGDDHRLDDGNR